MAETAVVASTTSERRACECFQTPQSRSNESLICEIARQVGESRGYDGGPRNEPRIVMAMRTEDLSDEEEARQAALERTWAGAQRSLADPDFRAYLDDSIARLNASRSRTTLTRDEFLSMTEADS